MDPISESVVMITPHLKAMEHAYRNKDLAIKVSTAPFSYHLRKTSIMLPLFFNTTKRNAKPYFTNYFYSAFPVDK